jgi:hypothetical protein
MKLEAEAVVCGLPAKLARGIVVQIDANNPGEPLEL